MLDRKMLNVKINNNSLIVNPTDNYSNIDINPEEIKNLVSEHGVVVLRDFNFSLDSFSKLVNDTSSSVTLDPARTFHSDVAQKVDAGTNSVSLHIENGNSPFTSDLAWFYCEHAAKKGSQTTYCDGVQAWRLFPDSLKKRFEGKKLVYKRNVSEKNWKAFLHFHSQEDNLKYEQLVDFTKDMDIDVTLNEDQSIKYTYSTTPTLETKQGTLAFANSILGPSYNYEKPKIYLDDVEIDDELLNEVEKLTEQCTYDLLWQKGDVLIVDNKRVMHGRRKIEDTERQIFNALSYI